MNAAFSHAIRNVVFGAIAALIVAGCARSEPETTDLSSVTVDSDRTKIEQALGESVEQRQLGDNTVAVYSYEKGYVSRQRVAETGEHILGGVGKGALYGASAGIEMLSQGSCDGAFCGVVVLIVPVLTVGGAVVGGVVAAVDSDESDRTRTTRELQRGNLAIVYSDSGAVEYIAELSTDKPLDHSALDDFQSVYTRAKTGDADAIFKLGQMAFLRQHELDLLRNSASAGHADAKYELGVLTTDDEEKTRLWAEAAAQGNVEAQEALANRQQQKARERRDTISPLELQQAASSGDLNAQLKLAERYRYGINAPENKDQAIHWYSRAAAAGDDFAPYALGSMYEEGETGTANPALAYIWYGIAERASADSAEDLQIRRDRLRASISPVDLTWADDIVRNWPSQIGGEASIGDPLAPLVKDPPSKEAQRKAEAEKNAKTAHRLSEWQARPDIVRKEIAKSHPEIYGGPWRITKFEVIGANLDERNDEIVRLTTRYSIEPRRGFGGPPEARTFRRFVVVDNSRKEVVEVQAATEIN